MPRPLRADARRNADRLRDAARQVFGEDGTQAPLEEVARRAGVSIGTLYNHFPRREQLLEAVLPAAATEQWERIRDAVAAVSDPTERFTAYLDEVLRIQATDRLLSDALAAPAQMPLAAADACGQVLALGETLLDDARRAGVPRWLDLEGLRALILGNAVVQRGTPPDGWDELLRAIGRAAAPVGVRVENGAVPGSKRTRRNS